VPLDRDSDYQRWADEHLIYEVGMLKSIDLYEISLTATPMHGATRVVSWKSAGTAMSDGSVDREWRDFQAATAKADRAHEAARRKREQQ
jgi:hypothetical protein